MKTGKEVWCYEQGAWVAPEKALATREQKKAVEGRLSAPCASCSHCDMVSSGPVVSKLQSPAFPGF